MVGHKKKTILPKLKICRFCSVALFCPEKYFYGTSILKINYQPRTQTQMDQCFSLDNLFVSVATFFDSSVHESKNVVHNVILLLKI